MLTNHPPATLLSSEYADPPRRVSAQPTLTGVPLLLGGVEGDDETAKNINDRVVDDGQQGG